MCGGSRQAERRDARAGQLPVGDEKRAAVLNIFRQPLAFGRGQLDIAGGDDDGIAVDRRHFCTSG